MLNRAQKGTGFYMPATRGVAKTVITAIIPALACLSLWSSAALKLEGRTGSCWSLPPYIRIFHDSMGPKRTLSDPCSSQGGPPSKGLRPSGYWSLHKDLCHNNIQYTLGSATNTGPQANCFCAPSILLAACRRLSCTQSCL